MGLSSVLSNLGSGMGLAPRPQPQAQPSAEDLIRKWSQTYGVDYDLALRVAKQESGLDQKKVSPKGAIGVMGLMPDTAKLMQVDPHDMEQNIRGGIKYLKQNLDKFGGNTDKALAAYNWGPQNIVRAAAKRGEDWPKALPLETKNYIKSVGSAGGAGASGDGLMASAASSPEGELVDVTMPDGTVITDVSPKTNQTELVNRYERSQNLPKGFFALKAQVKQPVRGEQIYEGKYVPVKAKEATPGLEKGETLVGATPGRKSTVGPAVRETAAGWGGMLSPTGETAKPMKSLEEHMASQPVLEALGVGRAADLATGMASAAYHAPAAIAGAYKNIMHPETGREATPMNPEEMAQKRWHSVGQAAGAATLAQGEPALRAGMRGAGALAEVAPKVVTPKVAAGIGHFVGGWPGRYILEQPIAKGAELIGRAGTSLRGAGRGGVPVAPPTVGTSFPGGPTTGAPVESPTGFRATEPGKLPGPPTAPQTMTSAGGTGEAPRTPAGFETPGYKPPAPTTTPAPAAPAAPAAAPAVKPAELTKTAPAVRAAASKTAKPKAEIKPLPKEVGEKLKATLDAQKGMSPDKMAEALERVGKEDKALNEALLEKGVSKRRLDKMYLDEKQALLEKFESGKARGYKTKAQDPAASSRMEAAYKEMFETFGPGEKMNQLSSAEMDKIINHLAEKHKVDRSSLALKVGRQYETYNKAEDMKEYIEKMEEQGGPKDDRQKAHRDEYYRLRLKQHPLNMTDEQIDKTSFDERKRMVKEAFGHKKAGRPTKKKGPVPTDN